MCIPSKKFAVKISSGSVGLFSPGYSSDSGRQKCLELEKKLVITWFKLLKNFLLELFKECSCTSGGVPSGIFVQQTPLIRRPRLPFWIARRCSVNVLQCDSVMMVFLFGRNSARITPLPSQKTVAMIFCSDIYSNIFGFGDLVCRHCKDCCLLSGVMCAIHVSSQWQWCRNPLCLFCD